jgi:hypothetical protein
MSPALAMALIVCLILLLALASAAAGALWWRGRSLPLAEAVRLADALDCQRRALEAIRVRLELGGPPGPGAEGPRPAPAASSWLPGGAGPDRRVDRKGGPGSGPGAGAGPTLIAVPDLSGPPPEGAAASTELARRFGAIWDLADAGASAEAIARGTGQPIGQVELILGLRRQLVAAAEGRA